MQTSDPATFAAVTSGLAAAALGVGIFFRLRAVRTKEFAYGFAALAGIGSGIVFALLAAAVAFGPETRVAVPMSPATAVLTVCLAVTAFGGGGYLRVRFNRTHEFADGFGALWSIGAGIMFAALLAAKALS